jgi:hypothetical protein
MCWQPETSGYSYLRVTTIQIDVTSYKGKSDQHATYIPRSTHSNLLCSYHNVKTGSYTRKKSCRPKTDWFSGYTATSTYWPIYQHSIGTFNTCLRRLTNRSLTDIGGGYNHLRAPSDLQSSNLHIASSKNVTWITYHQTVTFRPLGVYIYA